MVIFMKGCETIMSKVSANTHTQKQLNNYANQHNPNNSAYQANNNNHANQLIRIMASHKRGNNSKAATKENTRAEPAGSVLFIIIPLPSKALFALDPQLIILVTLSQV